MKIGQKDVPYWLWYACSRISVAIQCAATPCIRRIAHIETYYGPGRCVGTHIMFLDQWCYSEIVRQVTELRGMGYETIAWCDDTLNSETENYMRGVLWC